MKKSLALAVIAVFVMIPLASFARTAISDSELGSVIAQQGVTIEFVNLTLSNTSLTSMAWGDAGGFTGYTGDGWAGIGSITITGDVAVINGPMNIDVGTNGGSTRVNISLPTVSIGGTAGLNVTASVILAASSDLVTNATTVGVLDIKGLKTQVSGSVMVYAH
ncbi:MAG: hypothetical protein CVU62_01670 [Deltaproteobacteria bacterium HGW-Deltaproteobacteria-2]|jgi:hypothetical protein|nr:MAG: hypothetical protein CVU62_01670 [Deltaproteobacteria bacterium HGW-Deltaproteobacteria-2]